MAALRNWCTTPTSRQNCGNWPPPSILIGSPTPPIESLTSSVECAETCCVPCRWTHSRRHWRGAEAPRDPLSAVVVFALFPSNPGLSSLTPPETSSRGNGQPRADGCKLAFPKVIAPPQVEDCLVCYSCATVNAKFTPTFHKRSSSVLWSTRSKRVNRWCHEGCNRFHANGTATRAGRICESQADPAFP